MFLPANWHTVCLLAAKANHTQDFKSVVHHRSGVVSLLLRAKPCLPTYQRLPNLEHIDNLEHIEPGY